MLKKIKDKIIRKCFRVFFKEIIKEENLKQLSTAIFKNTTCEDSIKFLFHNLKTYGKRDEELLELFHDLRKIQYRQIELNDLYHHLKALGRTDNELISQAYDTAEAFERNEGLHYLQQKLSNSIQKDYKILMPNHGNNFRIEAFAQIYGGENIIIGNNFHAGYNFRIQAVERHGEQHFKPKLTIGENVSFEDYCHVGCIGEVKIGDNTMIASKVFITDHFHGDISSKDLENTPAERPLSYKPVLIGKNVWIGEGASIMPGVTLGNNVIVGANSVVTHSFEDNMIIAGCPAKVIRRL